MPVYRRALASGPSTVPREPPLLAMHLFLTDRISCPRCGPAFGLILLAHEVRDRRVLEGDLGCSNCRETYPVRGGFGDLRIPPRAPLPSPAADFDTASVDPEEILRVGALLGVTEGPGTLLIKGPAARYAAGLAELIPMVEVVGLESALIGDQESEGVSRMIAQLRIPFFSGSFMGILLSGEVTDRDLDEAARVVAPLGRVVVLDASPEAGLRAEALGLKILLEEEGVLVAQHEQTGSPPLVTLRGL
jgi:uncharacterized protein YbaR (Trm112 family)